jgi:Cu+-exporting ATPase
MVRREFIQGIASGLGVRQAAGGSKTKTLTYRIEGFTCITCAVGLDTLLKEEKGIVRSKSSYADRITTVEYDPDQISEEKIRSSILECGFRAVLS